jgi:hypothetical protein
MTSIDAVELEVGGTLFTLPQRVEVSASDVFKGKYEYGVVPDVPRIRRILDLGAGVGAFACWAWGRWRNSWIDCYETDPELLPFLRANLPPGAMAHDTAIKDAAASSLLARCDVLMLDVGGNEADVLRGYRHRPSVVCFEWHREQDRLDIESTLDSWGLRCFGIHFKEPDLGHQVWLRSRAVWSTDKKAYQLP